MRDRLILDRLTSTAWALYRPTLDKLAGVVTRHARGELATAEVLEQLRAARAAEDGKVAATPYTVNAGLGVVPVSGVLSQYSPQVEDVSAPRGTSCDSICQGIRAAVADDRVHTILLRINSPGGSVNGLDEVARTIAEARAVKPVLAHTEGMAASAAYWIASQAAEVHASPNAALGSIGVYTVLVDSSKLHEAQGVAVHVVRAGAHKGVGEPGAPITEEHIGAEQDFVNDYYSLFVDAVANGRRMDRDAVLELADGRLHIAAASVANGLADSVTSLTDLVAKVNADRAARTAANLAASRTTVVTMPAGYVPDPVYATSPNFPPPAPMPVAPQTPPITEEDMSTKVPAAEAAKNAPSTVEGQTPDVEAIRAAAVAAERERITYIRSKALDYQSELADRLIADGATKAEAIEALHDDLTKNAATRGADVTAGKEPIGVTGGVDPDGSGEAGEFDESTGEFVKPGSMSASSASVDYDACVDADDVNEIAAKEWRAMSAAEREATTLTVDQFKAERRYRWSQAQQAKRFAY